VGVAGERVKLSRLAIGSSSVNCIGRRFRSLEDDEDDEATGSPSYPIVRSVSTMLANLSWLNCQSSPVVLKVSETKSIKPFINSKEDGMKKI